MTNHLSLIKIPVKNIKKSLDFYEKYLNIQNIFFVEQYGWAQFDLDGIPFALYQVGSGGGERQVGGSIDFHLTLEEEVFNVQSKVWLEAGLLEDHRIHQGNDGTTFVNLIDVDQNKLKIMCIKKLITSTFFYAHKTRCNKISFTISFANEYID